jgi:hypothetical protein
MEEGGFRPIAAVGTGRNRPILLKKSVPSRRTHSRSEKRSIRALLCEIWSKISDAADRKLTQ